MKVANLMVIGAMVLGSAGVARADGFVCTSVDGALTARAYNHVDPSEGTRSPSALIISDNTVQVGRRTIASFNDAKATLKGGSFYYVGKVDLRVTETSRKGEYIGGTRLGELATIALNVDYDYSQRVLEVGELVKGELRLTKRNGELSTIDMECERYKKN